MEREGRQNECFDEALEVSAPLLMAQEISQCVSRFIKGAFYPSLKMWHDLVNLRGRRPFHWLIQRPVLLHLEYMLKMKLSITAKIHYEKMLNVLWFQHKFFMNTPFHVQAIVLIYTLAVICKHIKVLYRQRDTHFYAVFVKDERAKQGQSNCYGAHHHKQLPHHQHTVYKAIQCWQCWSCQERQFM